MSIMVHVPCAVKSTGALWNVVTLPGNMHTEIINMPYSFHQIIKHLMRSWYILSKLI